MHLLSTPKFATGLATWPAIIEPSSLRAYLAKMCDRNEDNQMFTDEDIMKSEASGPVVYWFSMSDCQIIMARAGLLEFVHIVTDEALQRDPAAPQDHWGEILGSKLGPLPTKSRPSWATYLYFLK